MESRVTLYKCFRSHVSIGSRSIGNQGIQTTRYKPSIVFMGAHFDKEPMFNKLIINYSYLDEWVNINGFDIPAPTIKGEYSIKYKLPEDINITLDENYDLKITNSVQGPNLNMVQKELHITQTTHIMIGSKIEIPISRYHDIINVIKNFLSFGVDRPVYTLAISGESEGAHIIL